MACYVAQVVLRRWRTLEDEGLSFVMETSRVKEENFIVTGTTSEHLDLSNFLELLYHWAHTPTASQKHTQGPVFTCSSR